MKILLTGSGGFIGKNLKQYLSKKYELLTPRSFELDLREKGEVEKYFLANKIDFIIHCASVGGARGVDDPTSTIGDNLNMLENILREKHPATRVIIFGSGAMYDKTIDLKKVKESEIGKFIPKDSYGKSKLLMWKKTKNRDDVLMLNIFACYGYGEKETRFPSYAIDRALNNEKIEINQDVIFDYLFVEDMIKIVEYFIENSPEDNVINITPTVSVSLSQIAKIVQKISDSKIEITVKNPIMNKEYTGDNTLLKKNFPSVKFTEIEEGLSKFYEYKKELQTRELRV